VNDPHSIDGSGIGTYSSNLQQLTAGTTYHVRAYAICTEDTVYGNEVAFNTLAAVLATVYTYQVTGITQTTATGTGGISFPGGVPVTQSGLCWNTTGNPTISDQHTISNNIYFFTDTITGLNTGSEYYVRAYAVNSVGTSYGNTIQLSTPFQCGSSAITDHDGNSYGTVKIGTQCWMKENLKTTHYNDGIPVPFSSNPATLNGFLINDSTNRFWCAYANDINNKSVYGLLYTWAAVMKGSSSSNTTPSGVTGICPAGWHVPSDNEWKQLEMYLGMTQQQADSLDMRGNNEGAKIKETGNAHWYGTNAESTNETGFTALPGGSCFDNSFSGLKNNGNWWSSTASPNVFTRYMTNDYYKIGRTHTQFNFMYSVRCLRDSSDGFDSVSLPVVNTASVSYISPVSASASGSVTNDGGSTVTDRGFCWNTTGLPNTSNDHSSFGSGTGNFSGIITGLATGNTYFVRAYATNSNGTAYGNQLIYQSPFICGSTQLTDADGNLYNTIPVGSQCWMKENLKTTHYSDGVEITTGTSAVTLPPYINNDSTNRFWFVYDNDISNKDIYGLLYPWAAVMRGAQSSNSVPGSVQGICPDDWHVPSDNEWKQLEIFLGLPPELTDSIGVRGTDEGGNSKNQVIHTGTVPMPALPTAPDLPLCPLVSDYISTCSPVWKTTVTSGLLPLPLMSLHVTCQTTML
jgi:uncharacterized protein (TIGR02145 family)